MRAVLCACLAVAGSAHAQATNEVFLNATYLGAPTEWCPAERGVPVEVTMDGPDIVKGPKKWPGTVVTRRGGEISHVSRGENTTSFWNEVEIDKTLIGRFSAEYRTCVSLWGNSDATGAWRLKAPDGSEIAQGEIVKMRGYAGMMPFFSPAPGPSRGQVATFGELRLYVAEGSRTTITQNFAAGGAKE